LTYPSISSKILNVITLFFTVAIFYLKEQVPNDFECLLNEWFFIKDDEFSKKAEMNDEVFGGAILKEILANQSKFRLKT